jgi:Fic family protein
MWLYSADGTLPEARTKNIESSPRRAAGGCGGDILRWLAWFLRCLGRAIDGADRTLAAMLHKARLWQRVNRRPVNERQRLVINRLLSDFKGHLSTSKYAKLAKCSTDTALRDIRELLERRILVQKSTGGRSTSYRLGGPQEVGD